MSRFLNIASGITVSVDDAKDSRFTDGWVSADAQPVPVKRSPGRPKKSAE